MINLLSPDDRRQLAAARTNTLLLRYNVLTGVVIGLLLIEIVGVSIFLNIDKVRNDATIAENESKTAGFADTKQKAQAFQTNLATAKYILDKQIPYTTLILTLANNLPDGAVLDRLTIDPLTFGQSTSINVQTISYARAIEVKSALQNTKVNGKPLFASVGFNSVSSSSDVTAKYPFTAIYDIVYSPGVL